MSPNVGNFVQDLVEMAKATEQLPIVQHELDTTKAENDSLHATVMAREESILKLKAEIEALQSDKHKLEVERDDAEMRFLELDERANKAVRLLDLITDQAKDAALNLAPPKPEPQPEPVILRVEGMSDGREFHTTAPGYSRSWEPPTPEEVGMDVALNYPTEQDQRANPPSPSPAPTSDANPASNTTTADASTQGNVMGERESPLPEGAGTFGETGQAQRIVSSQTVSSPTDAAPNSDRPQPYAGMTYSEWAKASGPDYGGISYATWAEGGGTRENWYL